ncbi:hypothetical protein CHS0354_027888 [Potamilus streckersoni]|uniref:MAM domain-containing protein n=1 Tax=Potamilus streckersoni TaxID=2493646 RepID=A0AAE0W6Q0_9BIVA|nr:hypothetical protein CHS0354_027888 [Potamilus streckersoni]
MGQIANMCFGYLFDNSTMDSETPETVELRMTQQEKCQGESPSCDFESDLCGWYELSTTSLKWRLKTGKTPDFTSGPQGDHTYGSKEMINNVSHV